MPNINLECNSPEELATLERINTGGHGQNDISALRRMMKDRPGGLTRGGDVAEIAIKDAIDSLTEGSSDLVVELVKGRRDELRAELGHADALPVERLLIDQIIMAWLRCYQAEVLYTARLKDGFTKQQGEYWERRLSATQRRFLRAVETYARVGKLLRSVTLQVNIGEKQVNVAGNPVVGKRPPTRPQRRRVKRD